jgi:hypothetical protein
MAARLRATCGVPYSSAVSVAKLVVHEVVDEGMDVKQAGQQRTARNCGAQIARAHRLDLLVPAARSLRLAAA